MRLPRRNWSLKSAHHRAFMDRASLSWVPLAFRAVDFQWRPNGALRDPRLGDTGNEKPFPVAVLWQGNKKWFIGNQKISHSDGRFQRRKQA